MTVWVYYSINKPTNSCPKVQRQHDLFVITKLIPFKASLLKFSQWTQGHKSKYSPLWYWVMNMFIFLSTNFLEMKGHEQLLSTSGSSHSHFRSASDPLLATTDSTSTVPIFNKKCFSKKQRNYLNFWKKYFVYF